MKNRTLPKVLGASFALLMLACAAFAQVQSGSIYGTTKDDKGALLPGASVTLTGSGAPQSTTSDVQGQFRFIGLSPSTYAIKAELQGFSTVDYPNVVVNVGRNTTIELALSAAAEDVITVTAESPVLDERKVSTGANLSQLELSKVPSARDPWTMLQTVPGVLVDRINIGGSESGQQSNFVSPGAAATQSTWAIDGVAITDLGAQGSSPVYYDFDSFEEMNFATGGSDAQTSTPGVTLNLVTKRGTNDWRGNAKGTYTSDKFQSKASSVHDLGPGQPQPQNVTRIDMVRDVGGDVGGPVWKEHAWIWAAYDKQQINRLTPITTSATRFSKDRTQLESKNAKLNFQFGAGNSASGTYFNNDKVKLGRNIGNFGAVGTSGDAESLANQGHAGDVPSFWKVDDTQVFNSNFFLSGTYNIVNGGFGFVPVGGDTQPYCDASGTCFHSTVFFNSLRPQKQYRVEGSAFMNTGSLNHEFKFGAGYRKADVTSISQFGGGGIITNDAYTLVADHSPTTGIFVATRPSGVGYSGKNKTAFAQDTMTTGAFTFNVGVHYDNQQGETAVLSVPANSFVPSVLPGLTTVGSQNSFTWTNVTPRLGITYALGAERKTLLRASYSRYADGLGNSAITQTQVGGPLTYAYFYTTNLTGTNFNANQIGAIVPNTAPPLPSFASINHVSSNLKAPTTDELLLSAEHALLPEFTVGVNLTYRKYKDPLQRELLVGDGFTPTADTPFCGSGATGNCQRRATRADYTPTNVTLANGRVVTVYHLSEAVGFSTGNDMFNGNWGQTYKGISLVATKRLSNRWMLRGNISYNDWKYDIKSNSYANPTEIVQPATLQSTGGFSNGDQVLNPLGGSGKGTVFVSSKWAYNINGLYQIAPDRPWGFDAAASLYGRQGYPFADFQSVSTPFGITGRPISQSVQATAEPDSHRFDTVNLVDLRFSKDLNFSHFTANVGIDVFNLFNKSIVLNRTNSVTSSRFDFVTDTTSPRVFRLGVKLGFQ
ncbi:MAG: carboxypeptidase regulatory-like domain-containing protein [Acidobacteriota bacterium]